MGVLKKNIKTKQFQFSIFPCLIFFRLEL